MEVRNGSPALIVHMTYWEDDADTNTTKKDRGSVHIATLTVCFRNPNDGTTRCTYPISIGAKDENHELARSRFVSDMNDLSAAHPLTMYVGFLKKEVPVYCEVGVFLLDRVARGDLTGSSQGNGKFSAVWGANVNLGEVHHTIPYCSDCLRLSLAGAAIPPLCPRCDGWKHNFESGKLDASPPPNYPAHESGSFGLVKDPHEAFRWYEMEAMTVDKYRKRICVAAVMRNAWFDDVESMRRLAEWHRTGENGFDICPVKSKRWDDKATVMVLHRPSTIGDRMAQRGG